jgi:hypothetical protein
MALHWDINKCADPNALDREVLEGLIFACLSVDLPGINRRNLDEWVFRLAYLRHIGHAIFRNPELETAEELEPFVGLSANVATLTRARWVRKTSKWIEREVESALRRKEKEKRETDEGSS